MIENYIKKQVDFTFKESSGHYKASKSDVYINESNRIIKGNPLLKWPGGKRNLLKHLLPLVPEKYNNYYEPFLGGGALFFAMQPRNSKLSDVNPELTNCYQQVRDHPQAIIEALAAMENSEDEYYRIRAENVEDPLARAVHFIYLTTLSFNGIYRLNLKGEFNVPYGKKTHLMPCDPVKITETSNALQNNEINLIDFEDAVQDARAGDLVYFDPPYTTSEKNNSFLKYNSKVFSWEDQIRLSNLVKRLSSRGCKVIISNTHHPSILELYKDFSMLRIERNSIIAASTEHRKQITECIFFNGV